MKRIHRLLIIASFLSVAFGTTFNDYFRMAAEQDPGLQAEYQTVRIAMEKAAQVAALPDPSLSFGYFISPVETRLGPQQAKVSLSQMFPWFGTLKAQKHAAVLNAEAALQTFEDKRNGLYADLAAAYYPLLEREYVLDKQAGIIRNLEQLADLAQSRFANGRGSMTDILRIERMLDESRTHLAILERKDIPLLTAFNAFLNRESQRSVEIQAEDLLKPVDAPDSTAVTDTHPLAQSYDLRILAKAQEEKAVMKKGLPSFGIGIDYVAVGDRTDMVVTESGRDVLMPMVSVSLPLARGKYRAAVSQVRLEKDRLAFQREDWLNGLGVKVASLQTDLNDQMDLARLNIKQVKTTQTILDLMIKDYAQNGTGLEELLRVQSELLQYETRFAAAMSRAHVLDARLRAVTAKLDE